MFPDVLKRTALLTGLALAVTAAFTAAAPASNSVAPYSASVRTQPCRPPVELPDPRIAPKVPTQPLIVSSSKQAVLQATPQGQAVTAELDDAPFGDPREHVETSVRV